MIGKFEVYKTAIAASVAVFTILGVYFYVQYLKMDIADLKSQLKDSEIAVANYKLENTRYKDAVALQNRKVEQMRKRENDAISKLREWKSKPAEVRYKTIYKTREVKSNECADIKNVISSVRYIDYDSL